MIALEIKAVLPRQGGTGQKLAWENLVSGGYTGYYESKDLDVRLKYVCFTAI